MTSQWDSKLLCGRREIASCGSECPIDFAQSTLRSVLDVELVWTNLTCVDPETVQDGRKHRSQDQSENPHGTGADLWCQDYAAKSDNTREPTQRKSNEQANDNLSQFSPLPEPEAGKSHLRGTPNSTSINKTYLATNLFPQISGCGSTRN